MQRAWQPLLWPTYRGRVAHVCASLVRPFRHHLDAVAAAVGAILGCATFFLWPTDIAIWACVFGWLAIIFVYFLGYTWVRHRNVYLSRTRPTILAALSAYGATFLGVVQGVAMGGAVATHRQTRSVLFGAICALLFLLWSHWITEWQKPSETIVFSDKPQWVRGVIADIEQRENNRLRVTLQNATLYGESVHYNVERIRFSARASQWPQGSTIGSGLSAKVMLFPFTPPAFAEDYNIQRKTFFNGLAGTGYVLGSIAADTPDTPLTWQNWLDNNRLKLSEYLNARSGPIASALLTGRRDGLTSETWDFFRESGLAHLLAISGLHLALLGGFIYFGIRAFFSFLPSVALRFPIHKYAAVAGILTTFMYMALAGFSIPTVRAFIMLSLLFSAVLLDRERVSLRVWCLAVLVVLALWPQDILTPSFQLSFAAAFFLVYWATLRHLEDAQTPFRQRTGYFTGIFLSSLVAGLATLPWVAYHFHQIAISGFMLNLIAIPLTGMVLLPLGFISLALIPLGLDGPTLWLFKHGLWLLETIASWGSIGYWQAIPTTPLLNMVVIPLAIVGLLAMLLRSTLGAIAAIFAIIAIAYLWPVGTQEELIMLERGRVILACKPLECKVFQDRAADRRLVQRYLDRTRRSLIPAAGSCDPAGCVHRVSGQRVLMTQEPPTTPDCKSFSLILSPQRVAGCPVQAPKLPPQAVAAIVRWQGGEWEIFPFAPANTRPWQAD